ncbi:Mitochondrial outer membrane protein porin [Ranunculus cassubicifolius]
MSKGPGLFSDIGKKSKDLLTKDYSYDQKFVVATTTNAGLGFTSSAVKKGGISTGDLALQYKYNNHVINLKVDTESNITTTITMQDFLPSVKTIATFKFPEYNGGKLEVQYLHDHAAVSTTVALSQSPAVDVSATFGTPRFAFGAEAAYETKLATFTKYNAGVSVITPDYNNVSVILADKGDTLRASYVHYLGEPKKSAGVAEISRRISTNENTFTVGGSHAFDQLTSVKAKLNNHGMLGALFQHEVKPKSILTISGEVDTKALDKNPRFGLSFLLKP